MLRTVLTWTLVVLVIGCAGMFTWYQLVKSGVLRYNEYDRREKGTLEAGHLAPDLELETYAGARVKLSELWASKPVFLVFGSCT
jgi:hypothetical protein